MAGTERGRIVVVVMPTGGEAPVVTVGRLIREAAHGGQGNERDLVLRPWDDTPTRLATLRDAAAAIQRTLREEA